MSPLRRRLFAVSAALLMVTIGFEVAVRFWPGGPGAGPDGRVINAGPDTTGSYVPSSQTVVNGTQTQGDCGSLWTDVQSSDNLYCKYREVNTAPLSPTALLPNAN